MLVIWLERGGQEPETIYVSGLDETCKAPTSLFRAPCQANSNPSESFLTYYDEPEWLDSPSHVRVVEPALVLDRDLFSDRAHLRQEHWWRCRQRYRSGYRQFLDPEIWIGNNIIPFRMPSIVAEDHSFDGQRDINWTMVEKAKEEWKQSKNHKGDG